MFVYTISDIIGLIFWGLFIGAGAIAWVIAKVSSSRYLRSKRK